MTSAIEVRCDACDGVVSLPAWESDPGRRTYPGRCVKCGGKGRMPAKSE